MAERWYLPFDYGGVEMTVNPTGDYVRYTDYARLQEQVEAYRQSSVHPDDYAAAITRAEAAEAERDRLREALEPFRRVLAVTDALPAEFKPSDDIPLREVMPGAWPSIGELRGVLAALQKEPQP